MIKIKNLFNTKIKKIVFALFNTLVTHQISAQSIMAQTEILNLTTKIESTNIQTQNYLWLFELQANPSTKTVSTHLTNPHPKLNQLNNRAIELAKEVSFEQLEQRYHTQKTQSNDAIPAAPLTAQNRFSLKVKFIPYIRYKYQPTKTWSGNFVREICQLDLTQAQYQHIYDTKTRKFHIELQFNVSKTGQINTYKILNAPHHGENFLGLDKLVNQYEFYSVNLDGHPVNFVTVQPFDFNCSSLPEVQKYENKYI